VAPLSPFAGPDGRLPWLLRRPGEDPALGPEDREADRLAALKARRVSLLVTPVVGVAWLVVALVGDEDALRIATLTALILCGVVGVRAAVTTQRYRRRWMKPEDVLAPPAWVTMVTVVAAVTVVVAVMNVIADLQADRPAAQAIMIATVALAITALGSYAHLAGGRSVGAALRAPQPD
jgi:hypothetical protein